MKFESPEFVARLLSGTAMQTNQPYLLKVVVKDITTETIAEQVECFIGKPDGRNPMIEIKPWTPMEKVSGVYQLPVTIAEPADVICQIRLKTGDTYSLLSDILNIKIT